MVLSCDCLSRLRIYFFVTPFFIAALGAAQSSLAQEQATENETEDWLTRTMCAIDDRVVNLDASPSFTFTQSDGNNPRHLSALPVSYTHLTLPTKA